MSATFRRNLVSRVQTDSCVTILLKSVHSWTQCRDRREQAMSKTGQVTGVEWMNRQEDRERCKAGDWQKQAAGFISWDLIPASSHWHGLSLHLSEELSVKGLLKPDSFSLSTLLENTGGGGEHREVSQYLWNENVWANVLLRGVKVPLSFPATLWQPNLTISQIMKL